MIPKKSGGKVFGAHLTANERKAMRMEIKRELIQLGAKYTIDLQTVFLYWLHAKKGYGKKRLRQAWEDLSTLQKELMDHYQMDVPDMVWVCNRKLKEIGVDLEAWRKERGD